ncbi:MAG: hypothetical protein HY526_13730 [Betaproteobacteria bacterium]|nr:hypothetical protein [Betaproteobacteria bacterium]
MKHTLTLSRWHKVAERINTALKEREARVKTAFTATEISPWNKQGVDEKAAAIARRAADDLALVDAGAPAFAGVRARPGRSIAVRFRNGKGSVKRARGQPSHGSGPHLSMVAVRPGRSLVEDCRFRVAGCRLLSAFYR